jgi:hypothetical protein
MKNSRCRIKLFIALLILMLAANAAVLHFRFGIRISDLAGFITAVTNGDSSAIVGNTASGYPSAGKTVDRSGTEADSPAADTSDHQNDPADSGSIFSNSAIALELYKKLSLGDKIFLTGVLAKIGNDGLGKIIDMAGDGITAGEIEEIKTNAGNFLGPDDIARLEGMFEKYMHIYAEAES